MKYALKIASERKTGKTDSPNALQSIIQGKDEVRYRLILCSSTDVPLKKKTAQRI
jgi:hypothetical protein